LGHYRFLRNERIFKNAAWIDQIYVMHLLDHQWRRKPYKAWSQRVLGNYFLPGKAGRDQLIRPE
jgi:hypothetical protein